MKLILLGIAFGLMAAPGCSRDAPPLATCALQSSWHWQNVGGFAAATRTSRLAAPDQYSAELSGAGGAGGWTCANTVPGCEELGDGGSDAGTAAITTVDVNHAFEDADVAAAFTVSPLQTPLLFGYDTRPVDGVLLEVARDGDDRGFRVGAACPDTVASCTPIPAGITRLRTLLESLDAQQLQGDCALPD